MRAIDAEGYETNYYGIINKIIEFNFAGNKELKVVFFDCAWFDSTNHLFFETGYQNARIMGSDRL
jgi:hypothetical protein